jgi:hypothetical protein
LAVAYEDDGMSLGYLSAPPVSSFSPANSSAQYSNQALLLTAAVSRSAPAAPPFTGCVLVQLGVSGSYQSAPEPQERGVAVRLVGLPDMAEFPAVANVTVDGHAATRVACNASGVDMARGRAEDEPRGNHPAQADGNPATAAAAAADTWCLGASGREQLNTVASYGPWLLVWTRLRVSGPAVRVCFADQERVEFY